MLFTYLGQDFDAIVVLGGAVIDKKDLARSSEVLSLEDPDVTCKPLGTLSRPSAPFGSGGLFGDQIIFCSGQQDQKACFIPGKDEAVTTLTSQRYGSGSIVTDKLRKSRGVQMLWITGGNSEKYSFQSNTELLDPASKKTLPGPDLPHKLGFHCLVEFNDTHILMAGGRNGSKIHAETHLFDTKQNQWSKDVPSLDNARFRHSCGRIKIPKKGGKSCCHIIVAGGQTNNQGEYLSSVEMLDTSRSGDPTKWISGPDLPLHLSEGAGVTSSSKDAFFFIGGRGSPFVFKLTCPTPTITDCQWSKLDQDLTFGRQSGPVAILVPSSMVSCSKVVRERQANCKKLPLTKQSF